MRHSMRDSKTQLGTRTYHVTQDAIRHNKKMCMRHHKHDRHHETTVMSNYDKTLQDTMEHNMSHHKTS